MLYWRWFLISILCLNGDIVAVMYTGQNPISCAAAGGTKPFRIKIAKEAGLCEMSCSEIPLNYSNIPQMER